MREWIDSYNPFNSDKVFFWAKHLEGCAKEDFLPPVVVNLDLVLGCNYMCKHCIWAKRRSLKPTMVPIELTRKVPEFLHDWDVKACCIAGEWGDPSLYPEIALIGLLRLLHFWNVEVGIVSNGFAYTRSVLEAIAHYTTFAGFSVDAGTPETYAAVHNCPPENFTVVVRNMAYLANYIKQRNLRCEVGYKFLLYPESYQTVYQAATLARELGVRDLQIRPADLPEIETELIDKDKINELMSSALQLTTSDFRVATVRHKFTSGFKKKPLQVCYATPLTSTWCANGEVHLCVDRRDKADDILVNYREEGLSALRRAWNGRRHHRLIQQLNKNLSSCRRCTNYKYNILIEKCIVTDSTDRRLI